MKLQLALAAAILAVSTSAAQAADTRTPDILGSVSSESIQNLNKTDASKTRGEYFFYFRNGRYVGTYKGTSRSGRLGWRLNNRVYVFYSRYNGNGTYTVSR